MNNLPNINNVFNPTRIFKCKELLHLDEVNIKYENCPNFTCRGKRSLILHDDCYTCSLCNFYQECTEYSHLSNFSDQKLQDDMNVQAAKQSDELNEQNQHNSIKQLNADRICKNLLNQEDKLNINIEIRMNQAKRLMQRYFSGNGNGRISSYVQGDALELVSFIDIKIM